MQPFFFFALDQCYGQFDVTKSMFCLLIVILILPGSHRKRPRTIRVCPVRISDTITCSQDGVPVLIVIVSVCVVGRQ